MHQKVLIGLFLAATALSGVCAAQQPVDLFNGKDLTGWVQRGGKAKYTVENGEIIGATVLETPNSFLCTEKTYGDFIFECDFKVDPRLNSGVQFRSECFDQPAATEWNGKTIKFPASRVHGYQYEIDPDPIKDRWWTGGIYDEGRRLWMNPTIARTDDMFERLVSFASPGSARTAYAKQNCPADHKWKQMRFEGGDISTQIIKTKLSRRIMVQWDETSPRPYTRHDLIQGTKGTLAGYPPRAAIGGRGSYHEWLEGAEFEHPLYKRMGELAVKMGGHGGMDFIMLARIVECLRNGEPLDQNVYEGASWSSMRSLSAKSEAEVGMPQKFPDFTRGQWQNTKPLGIVS